ncbi:hypothetical protein, variant [Exophiala mesophila]|uniref:Uncharacterized protein n=1 Tax=Exophiala mesophila TaxID=212818 RepID=A0A0D1ZT09_EXOME|nr:hypothetical protein, variant [Exophiala mesophila]KIV89933.1 hypothetical protein, variant [Exophiala mesophila]
MPNFPSFLMLQSFALVLSIPILVESRPTNDNTNLNNNLSSSPPSSSSQSWQDWSNSPSSPSSNPSPPSPTAPWPIPNNSTTGNTNSTNTTNPSYTNTPVTISDLFHIPDLSTFDFNTTSPEPYNPNEPDPQGKFTSRIDLDESDIPAFITLITTNTTQQQSTAALVENINEVLTNVDLDPSNSVLADMLLHAINLTNGQGQGQKRDIDNATITLRELSLFLESCFLDFDSCLFWDDQTKEIVDATFAMAETGLWSLKSDNQSVWPSIAQWVIDSGVDLLVGDRRLTNDMVVPVSLVPGGGVSAAWPAEVPGVRSKYLR